MRRVVLIVLVFLITSGSISLVLVWVGNSRAAANRAGCMNNLRMLALLGTPFEVREGRVIWPRQLQRTSVWPGTVANEALTPEQRLSWVVLALPTLHEPKIPLEQIDRGLTWDATANRQVGIKPLRTLLCPARLPELVAGEPAPTMYVGIAGLGTDAATLPLSDPIPSRAGAFRYDAPTPIELFLKHDGVSQTLLFGQTTWRLGPWIRGGHGTVRGLEEGSPILDRQNAQFGGSLAEGAYFAFVDGSVRMFRYGTDPEILQSLATINGGCVSLD